MIEQECIDELADFAGLQSARRGYTERAMRGEIEFEPALRERVALLRDLPVGVVDALLAKRITPTPGGRELAATTRAHGAYTCLISGGFLQPPSYQRDRRQDRLSGKTAPMNCS